MDYFIIDKDWDETRNSPWDTIWHEELPHNALGCLYGSMPLAAIWRSPPVRLERRTKRPDVYGFVLHYAVTEAAGDLFSSIAKHEAEYLPVEVPDLGLLYVIHPLWPIDFDDRAKYSCNSVSRNITDVQKYSFTIDPDRYEGPRHLFRMRQAKGSAARDGGYSYSTIVVSEAIRQASEKAKLRGIVFRYICSA